MKKQPVLIFTYASTSEGRLTDLLYPYKIGTSDRDIMWFRGLPYKELVRAMSYLPMEAGDYQQSPTCPTLDLMLLLGKRNLSIQYAGYRVGGQRKDKTLIVEHFRIPKTQITVEAVVEIASWKPSTLRWEDVAGEQWLFAYWS